MPQLADPHLAVALDLPFVGVRDLDLHHQIRAGLLQERLGGGLSLRESRSKGIRTVHRCRTRSRAPSRCPAARPAGEGGWSAAPSMFGRPYRPPPPRCGRVSRSDLRGDERAPSRVMRPPTGSRQTRRKCRFQSNDGELGDGACVGAKDMDGRGRAARRAWWWQGRSWRIRLRCYQCARPPRTGPAGVYPAAILLYRVGGGLHGRGLDQLPGTCVAARIANL